MKHNIKSGANDAWANSPIGNFKYSHITKEDCNSLRPAIAYMPDGLARIYPEATRVRHP